MPVDQLGQRAVLDHYAVRHAGGARGEDHVHSVGAFDLRRIGTLFAALIQDGLDAHRLVLGGVLAHSARQHDLGPALFDHARAALDRIPGVDRDVRGTALRDTRERGDQFSGSVRHHRHQVSGPDTMAPQPASDPVAGLAELAVAQHPAAIDDRGSVGV
ncbi:MAG TPA: hypothetical protein VGD71_25955 [Kribbella sp.]